MPYTESSPQEAVPTSMSEMENAIREVAREGAQRLLQKALEAEIAAYLEKYASLTDEHGRQAVVRNGHAPEREIITGVGTVKLARPRVDERTARNLSEHHKEFTSAVLPKFMRRTPTVEGVVATLYLKGVSTNDFGQAMEAIFGEQQVANFSAATVSRLKQVWHEEYENWRTRSLSSDRYAHIWADGVYFNARIEGERNCILVVIGAKFNGEKELLGIADGVRESETSWKELLLELKDRGMSVDPKLAIADGGLGFWKALPQVFPTTATQRCWVHKTANVLDKLPKSVQPRAKTLIHDIYGAESEAKAQQAFTHFCKSYRDKYPKAVECLEKDRETLLSFYRFPAAHWRHIRSTNVIESIFATVRLRTYKTKGLGTRNATLGMVFKLVQEASRGWRKISKWRQLELVQAGRVFKDGELVEDEEKLTA